jgi:hypothetical protein
MCRSDQSRFSKSRALAALVATFTFGAQSAYGATYGSDLNSSWADTPAGKFECRDDKSTDYKQTIAVGSKRIYQEPVSPNPRGGPTLFEGILDEASGCPEIIANREGYLVIVRPVQPPQYLVRGYAIINFNDPKFPLVELGQGQDEADSKIPPAKRIEWTDKGMTLQFVGYLADEQTGSADTPRPKRHKVRFSFGGGAPQVVK